MPTYTFDCTRCARSEEAIVPKTQKTGRCPACQSKMTRRFPTPNIQTETTWLANRDDGFGDNIRGRRAAIARARAAGVSTSGKVYCPSLCRRGQQYDPQAWVADKADAARVARENNWDSPDLGVRSRPVEKESKPYEVADDIVARRLGAEVERREGDMTDKEQKDYFFDTKKKLSGKGN